MTGNILLIEDEKLLRANLALLLQSEGHTVTAVANGPDGRARLQQEPFDLVLTDIMMGEVSGFHIMEYIAAHCPDTPVIAITGYASAESAIKTLRQGAYDYIPKPFEIEMVLIAVQRALEKVQLQRQVQGHMATLEQRVAERTQALAETNQKLQASMAELNAAQERLIQSEKLSALGELISGFAHELNNPLTGVIGYAELLIKTCEGLPAEVRSMLEKSRQQALRCHQIVHNLLGFARKREPSKHLLDINTICNNTLDLLAYQLKVNNIQVTTHLEATLPQVLVDGHQLQQVLVNIVSNAQQAMATQGRRGHLTLTTTADAEWLYIRITDTGPGITPDHLHQVFDPFFTTKKSGTGLGLSLSYGLIKEHGGEITVDSTPGQGTTFTIDLPLSVPNALEGTSDPSAEIFPMPPQNILVIDDEQLVANMVVTMLQSLGHQAEAVFSSHEALQKMAGVQYDLLICDLKMPEVGGKQLYRCLQARYPKLCQRIIFYSGDTESQENREFFEQTGCLFLPKPFREKECKKILWKAFVRATAVVTYAPAVA